MSDFAGCVIHRSCANSTCGDCIVAVIIGEDSPMKNAPKNEPVLAA